MWDKPYHIAVRQNGDVYTFGNNDRGQLGMNNMTAYTTPQLAIAALLTTSTTAGGLINKTWHDFVRGSDCRSFFKICVFLKLLIIIISIASSFKTSRHLNNLHLSILEIIWGFHNEIIIKITILSTKSIIF